MTIDYIGIVCRSCGTLFSLESIKSKNTVIRLKEKFICLSVFWIYQKFQKYDDYKKYQNVIIKQISHD